MNSLNRHFLKVAFYFFVVNFANALECDDGLVNPVKNKDFIGADSKRYKTLYDGLYGEQEKSIAGLQSKVAEGTKAREIYFDTRLGKGSLERLERLKREFGYDASIAQLIDSDEEDFTPTHFQKHVTQNQKRFYIRGQKVVARLEGLEPEKESGANSRLFRLDRNCNVVEITGFRSMDPNAGNAKEFVVNSEVCEVLISTGKFPDDEKLAELKGFVIDEKFEEIVHRAKAACDSFVKPGEADGSIKRSKSKSSR